MSPLLDILRRQIAVNGPLTVAQYMAAALGHPQYGYYTTRDPLGAAGDFITAPEISQMFGELIGLWCAQSWLQLGRPDPVLLVELGPGRGTLLADALRAARQLPEFRAALSVHLVETSPALRALQRRALADAAPVWHDSAAGLPEEGPALVIANEFFDALPVRQFQRGPDGWHERLVDWDEAAGRLRFVLAPRPAPPRQIPPSLADAPEGSVAEICPAGLSLAAALGQRIAAAGGAVLIVDYGPAASTPGATLQAVRRHAYADPLAEPGEADLTAHVDFAALAAAARQQGAAVYGPVPQGDVLRRLGIGARAARLKRGATPAQAAAIDSALDRLTAPAQMGTLFKALALAHPAMGVPAGFEPDGFEEEIRTTP